MAINDLDQLTIVQLQTLYNAENQLIAALPEWAKKATDPDIKMALQTHLDITREQALRLAEIGEKNNLDMSGVEDQAMRTILLEGDTLLSEATNPDVRDSIILSGAEKIEHYEIAAYESTIDLAKKVDRHDISNALEQNYREEKQAASQIRAISDGSFLDRLAEAIT
jgi:ferritin-like metal-binding protein YciE